MAPQNHFSNGIEAFNHFNGSARTLKSDSHTNLFLEQIAARGAIANSHNKTIGLDGQTLNLSDVVSVARSVLLNLYSFSVGAKLSKLWFSNNDRNASLPEDDC